MEKRRVGAHGEHIKRIYDEPKTPYQRVLLCAEVSEQNKQKLRETYTRLNPAELRRTIMRKLTVITQRVTTQRLVGK